MQLISVRAAPAIRQFEINKIKLNVKNKFEFWVKFMKEIQNNEFIPIVIYMFPNIVYKSVHLSEVEWPEKSTAVGRV